MCEAGAGQAVEVAQGPQRMIKDPELWRRAFRLREEYMQGKLPGGCSLMEPTRVGGDWNYEMRWGSSFQEQQRAIEGPGEKPARGERDWRSFSSSPVPFGQHLTLEPGLPAVTGWGERAEGAAEGDLLLCLWATVWSQSWEGLDCWASVCRNKFVEFDMKPVCKRCYERFPLELKKRLKKLSDMTSRKAQPKSVDVNSV